jgi:V/A-type H+-transporting ATPase subunit A
VKAFLGLSYDRAYKRFYPAVDPLMSWSRYMEQLSDWFTENMGRDWLPQVQSVFDLLHRGEDISRMMQVTGEEGVSAEDFVVQQKATLVDMVYLQQDAFDAVDVSTGIDRQKESFSLLLKIVDAKIAIQSKDDIRHWFNRLTDTFKNLNYAEFRSDSHKNFVRAIDALLTEAT